MNANKLIKLLRRSLTNTDKINVMKYNRSMSRDTLYLLECVNDIVNNISDEELLIVFKCNLCESNPVKNDYILNVADDIYGNLVLDCFKILGSNIPDNVKKYELGFLFYIKDTIIILTDNKSTFNIPTYVPDSKAIYLPILDDCKNITLNDVARLEDDVVFSKFVHEFTHKYTTDEILKNNRKIPFVNVDNLNTKKDKEKYYNNSLEFDSISNEIINMLRVIIQKDNNKLLKDNIKELNDIIKAEIQKIYSNNLEIRDFIDHLNIQNKRKLYRKIYVMLILLL